MEWSKVLGEITGLLKFIGVMYFAVVVFIGLDLWSGVRKARKIGTVRTSDGYKRTMEKLAKYLNPLIGLTVVDVLLLFSPLYSVIKFLPAFPWITLAGVLFTGFIELKSIREKAEDKQKYKSAEMLAGKVIANRDDIAKIIQEVIKYMNTPDEKYSKENSDEKENK